MSNIEKLQKILEELHEINFGEQGIIHPIGGGKDYNFHHECGKDFVHKFDECNRDKLACTECDKYTMSEKNVLPDGTRFTFVAHGTHTLDFIEAHKHVKSEIVPSIDESELEKWSTKPVMFVLENPSNGKKNNYFGTKSPENKRFPTESWYWLSSKYDVPADKYVYPYGFATEWYGGMMFSIMKTFHIANGYVTDFVKCGIGTLNKTLSTKKYDSRIIQTCIQRYFQNELDILRGRDKEQSVIIIAFGNNAYNNVINNLKKGDVLVKAPHPSPRYKTKDEYAQYGRRVFTVVANALLGNNFYDGVTPIDPLAILSNNKQSVMKFVDVQAMMRNVFTDGSEYTSHYKEGYFTWYTNTALDNGVVTQIQIRYKKTKQERQIDDNFDKLWAEYSFATDEIKIWFNARDRKGKDKYLEHDIGSKYELCQRILLLKEKMQSLI